MLERKTRTTLLGCGLLSGVIWMRSRPGPRAPDREALPFVPAVEATRHAGPERTDPPRAGEAISVIARVFGGALQVDARSERTCVAGDFNHDGWQDLAVAARPAGGRVGELQGELANWILQDPRRPHSHAADVRVEENEALLAIVHGHGVQGWRCKDARQAYLLKGAFARLESRPLDDAGSAIGSRAAARRGNETLAAVHDGSPGFLHWTGARYAWRKGDQRERAVLR